MTNRDRAERLSEIKDEMLTLLLEARDILKGTSEEERARAYWLAHIRSALDENHSYLGGSMCTMADSVRELEDDDDED